MVSMLPVAKIITTTISKHIVNHNYSAIFSIQVNGLSKIHIASENIRYHVTYEIRNFGKNFLLTYLLTYLRLRLSNVHSNRQYASGGSGVLNHSVQRTKD